MTAGQRVVQPVLSDILPNSPAAAAGLQAGDRVLSVAGKQITDFMQMQEIILAHPDGTLSFTLNRQGKIMTQQVVLGDLVQGGKKLAVWAWPATSRRSSIFSPPQAIVAAAVETWNDARSIVIGIGQLVVHRQGLQDLAGPLGIAQITGKVAALGFVSLVNLVALLSINLGLVNLIPIPILDGGHLLFYAAEAVFRRPIPARAQDVGLRIGIAIILSLFVVTTFNDLTRLGAVSWVAHLFG